MDEPRTKRFLIVESDARYAQWLQHAVGAGWPADSVVVMDWSSFGRVHTAMTTRDYDVVLLALSFDEGLEDITTDGFDWIRKLRIQPGFPEMIVLADGGSELAAVRTLRLGAADYLPKRLLNPARLQRSMKLTLRAIEKQEQRRAERLARVTSDAAPARPVTPDPSATATSAALAALATAPAPVTTAGPVAATAAPTALASSTAPAPTAPTASSVSTASAPAATAASPSPMESAQPSPTIPAAEATSADPAPAPKPVPAPPAASPVSPLSTHTGARIARAATLAVVPSPAKPVAADVSVRADSPKDPSSLSLPAAREPKPIAPDIHQIPGYTLLQKIGESEAAAVYLAISEDVGHNVALKVSKRRHIGDANDTGARAIMFQREFEAIAALDHPSIIELFDYGIHEGVEYLAMEYFPCGDLKARLQNPLTADEAIAFLTEIARSLKIVHDAGIIHRDLKPPNVMLRDDGSVVLIDFGLARSLMGGDSSTRTGVLRGSPYYMSPEQAQGETLDARTDLYSLGVILYEMLAGRKPYLGASAIDVLQQHVMAPVPELPVQHMAYQPLLERLMSKSRDQRIASCDELLAALTEMAHARSGREMLDPRELVTAGTGS
jgi:DNA-binding response OmpR family regulator